MIRAALVASILCFSCASIVAPGPDVVPVTSEPAGAEVYLNGELCGVTPTQLVVPRGHRGSDVVELRHGALRSTVDVPGVLNGWIFGNVLLGGIIGIVVDGITGNSWKVPHGTAIHATLSAPWPTPPAPAAPPPRSTASARSFTYWDRDEPPASRSSR